MADRIHDTTELPDDARQVCRLIIQVLKPLDGGPTETMPGEFARICHTVLAGARQTGGELDPLPDPLMNLAVQAEDAADLYRDVLHKVWEMARHGTGDHRDMERRQAERMKAREEGRKPPHEPTGYEVRGAMVASGAAGKPISEDEALALLKQHHAAA